MFPHLLFFWSKEKEDSDGSEKDDDAYDGNGQKDDDGP